MEKILIMDAKNYDAGLEEIYRAVESVGLVQINPHGLNERVRRPAHR